MRAACVTLLAAALTGCPDAPAREDTAAAAVDATLDALPLDGDSRSNDSAIDTPPPPPDALDVCAALEVGSAPAVTVASEPGPAPASTGGTVRDGRYELIAATFYGEGGAEEADIRFALEITGAAYRMVLVSEGTPTQTAGGRLVTMGTSLILVGGCTPTPQDPAAFGYTATADGLTITATDARAGSSLAYAFARR